jgi:K+-sensing histidine kinase KdpD
MTGKQLEKLQNTPHYMMNDAGIAEPRHGLGLLIVQQIVRAHHGTTRFSSVHPHGFCVAIQIPLSP